MPMQNQPQKIEKDEQGIGQKQSVYLFNGSNQRFCGRRRGFSLIEILVVVSIIGLLVGIGTVAGVKMTVEARKEQTRAMMESLLAANDEYKAVTRGQSIAESGPVPGTIFTIGGTERYIEVCSQIKSCDKIVKAALFSSSKEANERVLRDGNSNGFKSVYDRWGTPIEYRSFNDQTGALADSPLNDGNRVLNSLLPLSRDPFFASAGPDEEWGTDDDITTIEQ